MFPKSLRPAIALVCLFLAAISCGEKIMDSATVPFTLDHNRMLVTIEIQRADGNWRTATAWIDTGNPDLFISEELANDLGIELSTDEEKRSKGSLEVPPLAGVRIGGMPLDFDSIVGNVMFQPWFLFGEAHNDINLPVTVLRRYQVVFDYPRKELTLAAPGTLPHRGQQAAADINPQTGVLQIDADIDGRPYSFALDNGASYSFIADSMLAEIAARHPDWPIMQGAVGCANIWGWWPNEQNWSVMRLPELIWGPVKLENLGIAGLPRFSENGPALNEWYSKKTARPVDGFLGPNALKPFRIEIDYQNSAVYFEKGADFESHDMDLVGLTLRPQPDGTFMVIGVSRKDGKPSVEGVEPGDLLLQVDDVVTNDQTMGAVVDALRGKPGEIRKLTLSREGKEFTVDAKVERFL